MSYEETEKDDRPRINRDRTKPRTKEERDSQPRREPYKRQQKSDYLYDELDPYEED